MSASVRSFGALIAHENVALVEYDTDRMGARVLEQWLDRARSASIDEALVRLTNLIAASGAKKARVALAIEQFGVVQHTMTLPAATDEVLVPIVRREVQRVFGIGDPAVALTRGAVAERRAPARADERTAPRQIIVAAAPSATTSALRDRLPRHVQVECATVVPKAMHSLYEAMGGALEPTAVLVCLAGGPHLAFFLDGRLELAVDPPIALEGEPPTVAMILDQVERGAVFFRQQFRGATATRVLLAAPSETYDEIATAIDARLGARVKPLFAGVSSPEAVIAMGAVLESRQPEPLDLYPHPPAVSARVARALRGPNAVVATSAAAAVVAALWAGSQLSSLHADRAEADRLRTSMRASAPAVEPMRAVAERRADFARQVEYVRGVYGERSALTRSLVDIAAKTPTTVRFDSLRVSRVAAGWSVVIAGSATGATGAQSVRALDTFMQALRGRDGVSNANLDQLDYEAAHDSTHMVTNGPVIIQFRTSFVLARPALESR